WMTAKDAAATYGGLAAINGGFFTPEGKPLGLLIETGTRRGHLNRSSLGAGVFLMNKNRATIIRREAYQKSPNTWNAYNLLQTGPMLVEGGSTVSGLSKNNHRPRSFIAWDGKNHWAIGYSSSCTLDGLARAIANESPAGFKIRTAVNLDGGRSSDLWVGTQVRGGGKNHRGFLNKPVRNYLVLTKRKR
ncbi:MAG: phosphodiester glycosidase family protein, partial [Akkermansiaceae bacterium]